MEIWSAYLLPSVYAFAACVAFTFVFNIHGWGKLICGVGGAIGWLVYLLCGEDILAAFIAAVSIGIFSEVMARYGGVPLPDICWWRCFLWCPAAASIMP